MHYQTRHLEAMTDVAHGSDHYAKGDRFHASPVDADYLIGHNKAKAVETTQKPAAALLTKTVEHSAKDASDEKVSADALAEEVEPVKAEDLAPESKPVTSRPAAKKTFARKTASK